MNSLALRDAGSFRIAYNSGELVTQAGAAGTRDFAFFALTVDSAFGGLS